MSESDFAVRAAPYRALERWLLACIVAVLLAVVVGGITRLTESGLSITEWRPVSGVLPPSTAGEWEEAFAAFQRIPQASTTHKDLTLAQFKFIYWWEWFHRMLARGVGLVFAVPFVVLLARGRIPEHLHMRLTILPLLTLGQGALGWYMVKSGLSENETVSAYRLTAHLALALGILAVALWTLADVRAIPTAAPVASAPPPQARATARWRKVLALLVVCTLITLLSGGFVAGLRAGRIYNTFPLMGGAVIPPGYGTFSPWWRDAFENPAAAQFHHRVLALLTASLAIAAAVRSRASLRAGALSADAARAVGALGVLALVQVSLGIATLLLAVPVVLGVLHQLTGVFVLMAALLALHASGAARAPA